MSAALSERERAETAIAEKTDPLAIIQSAMKAGASLDQIEKLLGLAEREQKRKAKIAFDNAIAAFAANPPAVVRNKLVDFESGKGRTRYKHASLDAVCTQLKPALGKFGLSHRWRTEQLDGGIIRVTCVLTHSEGHAEETALQCLPDISGGKNGIQGIGSTVTYLERYTLLAACGIAVIGDDDGAAAGKAKDADPIISEAQCKTLCDALNDTKSDFDKFCEAFRIGSIDQLPTSQFKRAMDMIAAKKKGGKK
jgi:hypothetical protein